jgi:hypothetical protein
MTPSAGNSAIGNGVDSQQPTEFVSVALLAKVAGDLESLQERTGLSRTDIINRAISLYEFIEAQLRAKNDLLIRSHKTKKTRRFRFFLFKLSIIAIAVNARDLLISAETGRSPYK